MGFSYVILINAYVVNHYTCMKQKKERRSDGEEVGTDEDIEEEKLADASEEGRGEGAGTHPRRREVSDRRS